MRNTEQEEIEQLEYQQEIIASEQTFQNQIKIEKMETSKLIVTEKATANFKLAPTGNHVAYCIAVIDLGTHLEQYMGEDKLTHKIKLSFELPNEKDIFDKEKGEQPFVVSKTYTLSLNEKANLRKDLESWRGKSFSADELKGFDIMNLLGVPCMINAIHKQSKTGNEYVFISSISPLPKGMNLPERITGLTFFSLQEFKQADFDRLTEWHQNKIKESSEWKRLQSPAETETKEEEQSQDDSDILPF